MNDFEQAILLLRHPLNAIMSDFNDEWPHGDKKGYASLEVYHRAYFSKLAIEHYLPLWEKFYDSVLQNYENPLLVVQYEDVKRNFIDEMERILTFLGFRMTAEIKSCLIEDSIGHFKRKTRPQEEIDQIYKNFTMEQLDGIQNTYLKYVEKFEAKLIDLKIRQNLKNKYKTC